MVLASRPLLQQQARVGVEDEDRECAVQNPAPMSGQLVDDPRFAILRIHCDQHPVGGGGFIWHLYQPLGQHALLGRLGTQPAVPSPRDRLGRSVLESVRMVRPRKRETASHCAEEPAESDVRACQHARDDNDGRHAAA